VTVKLVFNIGEKFYVRKKFYRS